MPENQHHCKGHNPRCLRCVAGNYELLHEINVARVIVSYLGGSWAMLRYDRADGWCWVEIPANKDAIDAYGGKALDIIDTYGGIDGAHHKQWVLDQVVRALTGKAYHDWVDAHKAGDDGPNSYEWDEGIAP